VKRRCQGYKLERWRKRRRRLFKPFLPLIIMGSLGLLVDKINKLGALTRTQTQAADRVVTVKVNVSPSFLFFGIFKKVFQIN